MKVKTVKYRIPIPIFHGYLNVVVTDSMKEYIEENKLCLQNPFFDALVYRFNDKDGYDNYVYLQERKSNVSFSLIAHESKHLVNMIFLDRGIALDIKNDETECYLLGWVVDKIYLKLKAK